MAAPVATTAGPCERVYRRRTLARRAAAAAALFLAFLLLTVLTQISEGAYSRGVGAYPDEPAHYMSGLMIRDYVAAGFPKGPMAFAQDYYHHYPTLGIGYWPPLFYVFEAVWMLIFGISRTSVLLFVASISAALQVLLFWSAKKKFDTPTAAILAVTFALVPAVRFSNSMIMTDVFVALTCLAATLAFGRYLEEPSLRGGVVFGLLTGLALLTKLSSLFLALLVPVSFVVARKFALIRRASAWAAAAVVAVLFLPWLLYAGRFMTIGLLPVTPSDWWLVAWKEYFRIAIQTIGAALLVIGAAGSFLALRKSVSEPWWAAVVSQPAAVLFFLLLAPVGLEPRYLIVSLPSILLLSALAVRVFAQRYALTSSLQTVALAAVCLTAVFAQRNSTTSTMTIHDGIPDAADYVSNHAPPNAVILVSSSSSKEGRMVAEMAVRQGKRPGRVILRSSKLLAETDWNVTSYRQRFTTTAEIDAELERRSVQYVLVDMSAERMPIYVHHRDLKEMLSDPSHGWVLAKMFDGENGQNACAVFVRSTSRAAHFPN